MADEFHLVEAFGTAHFFKISSSNLEQNLFRFMALIFLSF